ncbi:hypothetical protein CRYUN_Cryun27aG0018600 [Craigia yunnanensis]
MAGSTKTTTLLLSLLCLVLLSEVGMLMAQVQTHPPSAPGPQGKRVPFQMNARTSVQKDAAIHGSQRCAIKHVLPAATGALIIVCLMVLKLAEIPAIATHRSRPMANSSALEPFLPDL